MNKSVTPVIRLNMKSNAAPPMNKNAVPPMKKIARQLIRQNVPR